jgi:hypothetical protein
VQDSVIIQLATGALGGALVSSIIGPYLTQSRERKSGRAAVLNSIRKVEAARWADTATPYTAFYEALAELYASALVSGADRGLTVCYARLATVARGLSDEDLEETGGYENLGGIPPDMADLVRDAAEALVETQWRPFRSRPFRKRLLEKILATQKNLERKYKRQGKDINWNPRNF